MDIMDKLEKFEAEEQETGVCKCFEKLLALVEVCVWFGEVLNKRST